MAENFFVSILAPYTDRDVTFDEAERKGIQIRGPINSRWNRKVLRGMGTCMDAYSMDHMLDWEESEENMDMSCYLHWGC